MKVYTDTWHYKLYRFWLRFSLKKETGRSTRCAYFWSCVFAVPLAILTPFLMLYATFANLVQLVFTLLIGHLPTKKFWWWYYYQKENFSKSYELSSDQAPILLITAYQTALVGLATVGFYTNNRWDGLLVFALLWTMLALCGYGIMRYGKMILPLNIISKIGSWLAKNIGSRMSNAFVYVDTLGDKYCKPVEFVDRSKSVSETPKDT